MSMSKEPEIVIVGTSQDRVSYSKVSIKEWKRLDCESALSYSFHQDTLRKIMGKTLTIIDACIPEAKQNKAMKDLVRQAIQAEVEFGSEMAFDQEELQKMVPENLDDIEDISLEEVLGVK